MIYSTWYRISSQSYKVFEARVTRATKSSVWIYVAPLFDDQQPIEKKVCRHSSWEDFYETKDEAVAELQKRAHKEKIKLEEQLNEINEFLLRGPKTFRDKDYEPIPASKRDEMLKL